MPPLPFAAKALHQTFRKFQDDLIAAEGQQIKQRCAQRIVGVIRCGQILGVLAQVEAAAKGNEQHRSSLSARSSEAAMSNAQAKAQALKSKRQDSLCLSSRRSGRKAATSQGQPRAPKYPRSSRPHCSTAATSKAQARPRAKSKSKGSLCAPSRSSSSKAAAQQGAQAQAWPKPPNAPARKKRPAPSAGRTVSEEDLEEDNVIGAVFLDSSGGQYTLMENLANLEAALATSRQYWPRFLATISTAQGVLEDLGWYQRFLEHLTLKGVNSPFVLPHLLRKRCHVILTPEIQKSPEWQAMPFRRLAMLSTDMQGAAGHHVEDMTVAEVETAFGTPAHFLAMWACLLQPAMASGLDPQQVLSLCADPKNAGGPEVFKRNSSAAGQSVGRRSAEFSPHHLGRPHD